MWTYSQATGDLLSPEGTLAGGGYSGRGTGLNNPSLQNDKGVGPIPQGMWIISSFFDDLGGKGPIVAHLAPTSSTETFGRDGFMIHGDNSAHDHSASEGCIILAHDLRQLISLSGDMELLVTA